MKNRWLKLSWLLLGFGLAVLASCKPVPEEEYDLEFAMLHSGNYQGNAPVESNYTVCTDKASYARLCSSLSLDESLAGEVDFSQYSVLGLVDTLRPYPTYRLEVARVRVEGNAVEVQVKRELEVQEGLPSQAYAFFRIPKTGKPVRFVELPFEPYSGEDPNYMPELGTTGCLAIGKSNPDAETFWFKFLDDGKMVVERRNVLMNCAQTTLEASVVQDGSRLIIHEEEQHGPDLTVCRCYKNAAYMADVTGGRDSLQVELSLSTTEISRVYAFKIPGHGSGEVVLRSW